MLSVSLIRCKNEALKKKLHLKSTIKCFKEVKIDKRTDLSDPFLPIDCVIINGISLTVYSVVIFSHRYLDSDHINFKTFVFLAIYWSIWTSSYNTNIKVQHFFEMEPPQCWTMSLKVEQEFLKEKKFHCQLSDCDCHRAQPSGTRKY